MAEIKKTEAAVKPVATIKTPAAPEAKAPEVKAAAPAKAEEKKPAVKKAATTKKATAKKAPAEKKAPAAKKAEVKAEEKAPKKAATAKKAAAKKAPAEKKAPAAKKTAAKKEAAPKAAEVKANIVLQYGDKNVTYDTIVQNAKNHFQYDMGGDAEGIKKLSVYVKPEENAAYYVVDDKVQGRIDL